MLTNTKTLFVGLLRSFSVDCVCDVGSRDGDQSILFRDVLPEATVLAFEANDLNYRRMEADARLKAKRILIFPKAVSDTNGVARFHITDVDYSDPAENRGTSSLLTSDTVKIKETVEVETCRIDDFLKTRFPTVSRVALWIDVEGAEYSVLKGMEGIRDKVVALHVETAERPFRPGQKTYSEVTALLREFGFVPAGSNIRSAIGWGDVVFIREALLQTHAPVIRRCKRKALLGHWLPVDSTAVFLKDRFPAVYRALRKAYLRVGT